MTPRSGKRKRTVLIKFYPSDVNKTCLNRLERNGPVNVAFFNPVLASHILKKKKKKNGEIVPSNTRAHTHTHTHIYIYIYIYTHTHTYIYIYICICSRPNM